jgi:hypothetical protein
MENKFCEIIGHDEYYTMVIMMKCTKIKSIKQLKILLGCDEVEIFWEDTIKELYHNYDLAIGDLKRVCSWGLTDIGQPVLIDYGCTTTVFNNFYRIRFNY